MKTFIHDMIHLTEGEKFIYYWWLWLIFIVMGFGYMYIKDKKTK